MRHPIDPIRLTFLTIRRSGGLETTTGQLPPRRLEWEEVELFYPREEEDGGEEDAPRGHAALATPSGKGGASGWDDRWTSPGRKGKKGNKKGGGKDKNNKKGGWGSGGWGAGGWGSGGGSGGWGSSSWEAGEDRR